MNKTQFIDELRRELTAHNVRDIEEIIAEYEEHFYYKTEAGKSEEEIARKLSSPHDIAIEYAEIGNKPAKNGGKAIKITGLAAFSVPLAFVYVLMWGAVLLLGALSAASLVLGFCLITKVNVAGLVPYLPYFPSFVLGIASLGLCVLSAIGTVYAFLYVRQWGLAYVRWCKNTLNGNVYPSLSMHPKLPKRAAHILRLCLMAGLIAFVAAFAAGYFSMCIAAGSMEPWHVWNWFV